ncbi:MAG: hypothetical protein COB77_06610 [Gammaproteobacteria bacterium]|nr:MAG: hypothetical protein COB77_06610 [Gammaproteobacteria bacterium]
MNYPDTVILVYAKAPVAGQVNTRLIPDIGQTAATQLQEDLIHQRLTTLTQSTLCDVVLLCAPDEDHEVFLQCKQRYPIRLLRQIGDDLGERMANGIKHFLQRYQYCIVVGTDAPILDADQIIKAIDVLHDGEGVVFVPAEDGGYVLVGMNKPHSFLFEGIRWGTETVMQQSRNKLVENNVSFVELDQCWDIDCLTDYKRYMKMFNSKQCGI